MLDHKKIFKEKIILQYNILYFFYIFFQKHAQSDAFVYVEIVFSDIALVVIVLPRPFWLGNNKMYLNKLRTF